MDPTEQPATYGSDGTCRNDSCTHTTVKRGPYGPPRLYCSNACRVAAYRQRQTDNPPDRPATAAQSNVTDVDELEALRTTIDTINRYLNSPAALRTVMRPNGTYNEAALRILTDLTDVIDSGSP